jgi:peptide/nickel transport system substrate-binding protein
LFVFLRSFRGAFFCFSGCGKKPEMAPSENSVTNYPLPDPPLVADCEPGILGGDSCYPRSATRRRSITSWRMNQSSEDIYRFLFASIAGFDVPSQEVVPGLAEWWTNSPDGKTWTFKLRKNLRWSDGEPLTADDVVFTWNDVIYNPKINLLRATRSSWTEKISR